MERQITELVVGLLGTGASVTTIARRCDLPEHPNLTAVRVPGPRRPFLLAYPVFFVLGSLRLAMARRGVVITTGAIVANRVDAATVHFCHAARGGDRTADTTAFSALNARLSARMARVVERWCYQRRVRAALIAVSSGIARELRSSYPSLATMIRVIPNGVDTQKFAPSSGARKATRKELGIASDAFVAVFVGGDWIRKGLAHAIEALAQAPDVTLIVAGPGDQARFDAKAAAAGTRNRVHFVGARRDVKRYYAAADVFVLPSSYEAFPLVVLEAASCGLPLLVTAVHGAIEIVEDGVTGYLIAADANDIAQRLRELASDRELGTRMGRASRERVASRSWSQVVASYERLISEIIQSDGSLNLSHRS